MESLYCGLILIVMAVVFIWYTGYTVGYNAALAMRKDRNIAKAVEEYEKDQLR